MKIIDIIWFLISKFVLDVLGASGAIWGSMEVIGLRTTENKFIWQIICIITGVLFFIRWSMMAKEKYNEFKLSTNSLEKKLNNIIEKNYDCAKKGV